jgi:hypothetical protein
MRTIKLMADYQCYPLWGTTLEDLGDISPADLPISDSLRKDLLAWAGEYDATLDLDDHTNIGFESQASADRFMAAGHRLLARLREELGPDYQVTHYIYGGPKSSAR